MSGSTRYREQKYGTRTDVSHAAYGTAPPSVIFAEARRQLAELERMANDHGAVQVRTIELTYGVLNYVGPYGVRALARVVEPDDDSVPD